MLCQDGGVHTMHLDESDGTSMLICTKCGRIMEHSTLQEAESFDGSFAPAAQGQKADLSRILRCNIADSGFKKVSEGLALGISVIQDIGHLLNLNSAMVDDAISLLKKVNYAKYNKIRMLKKKVLGACCLYLKCRQNFIPVTMKQISQMIQVDLSLLGFYFRDIVRHFKLEVPEFAYETFIQTFCSKASLSQSVAKRAESMLPLLDLTGNLTGYSYESIVFTMAFLSWKADDVKTNGRTTINKFCELHSLGSFKSVSIKKHVKNLLDNIKKLASQLPWITDQIMTDYTVLFHVDDVLKYKQTLFLKHLAKCREKEEELEEVMAGTSADGMAQDRDTKCGISLLNVDENASVTSSAPGGPYGCESEEEIYVQCVKEETLSVKDEILSVKDETLSSVIVTDVPSNSGYVMYIGKPESSCSQSAVVDMKCELQEFNQTYGVETDSKNISCRQNLQEMNEMEIASINQDGAHGTGITDCSFVSENVESRNLDYTSSKTVDLEENLILFVPPPSADHRDTFQTQFVTNFQSVDQGAEILNSSSQQFSFSGEHSSSMSRDNQKPLVSVCSVESVTCSTESVEVNLDVVKKDNSLHTSEVNAEQRFSTECSVTAMEHPAVETCDEIEPVLKQCPGMLSLDMPDTYNNFETCKRIAGQTYKNNSASTSNYGYSSCVSAAVARLDQSLDGNLILRLPETAKIHAFQLDPDNFLNLQETLSVTQPSVTSSDPSEKDNKPITCMSPIPGISFTKLASSDMADDSGQNLSKSLIAPTIPNHEELRSSLQEKKIGRNFELLWGGDVTSLPIGSVMAACAGVGEWQVSSENDTQTYAVSQKSAKEPTPDPKVTDIARVKKKYTDRIVPRSFKRARIKEVEEGPISDSKVHVDMVTGPKVENSTVVDESIMSDLELQQYLRTPEEVDAMRKVYDHCKLHEPKVPNNPKDE